MDPAVDPFHPMLRVIERYRHDVHQLGEPAGGDAVTQAMSHLGQPIPTSLLSFLHRWNGAALFRGALRIRSIAELAAASAGMPTVIVFADGPRETDHWAFAPDGQGGAIFGRWTATGGFDPLHHRFRRWLLTMVRILDENIRDERAQLEAHLDSDPECGYLLLKRAENLLADGDPDAARDALRKATAVDPDLVRGWELLGDTMMGVDRSAARWAYLKALRAMRLPRPYPTLYTLAPTLIRTLGRLFPVGDPGMGARARAVRARVRARRLRLRGARSRRGGVGRARPRPSVARRARRCAHDAPRVPRQGARVPDPRPARRSRAAPGEHRDRARPPRRRRAPPAGTPTCPAADARPRQPRPRPDRDGATGALGRGHPPRSAPGSGGSGRSLSRAPAARRASPPPRAARRSRSRGSTKPRGSPDSSNRTSSPRARRWESGTSCARKATRPPQRSATARPARRWASTRSYSSAS